jgi:acetoin utilization deacetylase AcuC-like enzyme
LRARDVPIVYSERYQHSVVGVPLDPLRGEKILSCASEAGGLRRGACRAPEPASFDDLLRAHAAGYLESLHRGDGLARILGVELSVTDAEATLDLQRLMVGGTVEATRLALRGKRIAFHLGGGFHHAMPAAGQGFCVFNDVAVAVRRIRAGGFAGRVLVVDLDLHDGNGIRAAFAEDPTVHTLSIHNEHWGETEAVQSTSIALGSDVGDAAYLDCLRATLPGIFERFRPELVYYLAGTDVAASDALGNWRIGAGAILERDRLVTELARRPERPLPMVALLAGGYGSAAWRYSARYLLWATSGRELEPLSEDELALRRFRRLRAFLPVAEARNRDSSFALAPEDLVSLHPLAYSPPRFLDHLSRSGVEFLLDRFGILPRLRAKGYPTLSVAVAADVGSGLQTLRVTSGRGELLIELRAGRSRAAVQGMEVVAIEWLLLQNPRAAPSSRRPLLPGQQRPGLGLLRDMMGWLVLLCDEHGLDGIHFVAAHYHIVAQSRRLVRLLRPADEARVRALSAVLADRSLAEAAEAIAAGGVVDADGRPVVWEPAPCVIPVSARLAGLVSGPAYERAVGEAAAGLSLRTTPARAPAGGGRRASRERRA